MPEELQGERQNGSRRGYEQPRLKILGTIADITQGVVPTTTDGLGPGSVIPP